MITGAHVILNSKDSEADRKFFLKTLKFTNVDVGDGWLIFGLPASELAVHPDNKNDVHELYLMCDDIKAFVAKMKRSKINCSEIKDQGWGLLTQLTLPGGGKLGIYQPRHARPEPMMVDPKVKRKNNAPAKKSVAKKKSKKVNARKR